MLIRTGNGTKYILHFSYFAKPVRNSKLRGTRAVIKNQGEVIASGEVVCDSREMFIKAEGRKKAITKALQETNFDRQKRKEFWDSYHEISKPA